MPGFPVQALIAIYVVGGITILYGLVTCTVQLLRILRHQPYTRDERRRDFLVLTAWGVATLALLMMGTFLSHSP